MLKSHQRGDLTPAETKVDYLRRFEWRHVTITELKERKCAGFTSEEKTHETIRMGE